MDNQSPILELKNVSKSFGQLKILTQVSLSLNKGGSTVITGPSGVGKSTLLHITGLMEKPSDGQVHLNGKNTNSMTEKQKSRERLNTIGFLFQFHHLLADFTVLENVLIPARLAQDDLNQAQKRACEILGRLGLSNRLHHKPHQLSGGEQQRVAFVRAIIRRPQLLLCDEPTGNLDLHTAQEMMNFMWDEISAQGLCTLIVTHNETLVKKADMSYHLLEGQFKENTAEAHV